jgi:hypothetical protein
MFDRIVPSIAAVINIAGEQWRLGSWLELMECRSFDSPTARSSGGFDGVCSWGRLFHSWALIIRGIMNYCTSTW